jgi:hypothetical protein
MVFYNTLTGVLHWDFVGRLSLKARLVFNQPAELPSPLHHLSSVGQSVRLSTTTHANDF